MKRKELIEQICQYKAEINRHLNNASNEKEIGFTLATGKTPTLYWVDRESKKVINTIIGCNTGKELLTCIKTMFYILKNL